MPKQPYSLWRRKLSSGKTVYYVRFRLDDGSWSTAKSSKESKKSRAIGWAIDYLNSGQIVLKENITFKAFSTDFFDYEGPYVKSLLLRGRSFSQRHAKIQQGHVNNYLIPEFGATRLQKIDSDMIEEFTQDIAARSLSSSTINHILQAMKTILQYAYKKKFIQRIPIIEMVPRRQKERGILTVEEVKAFFSQDWKDHRYYAINLIAGTTGMRMGEIRALQRKAVHEDYLDVTVSWEKDHGLKGTKTGRSRYVPMPLKTRVALEEVLKITPFTEPDDFIFFGRSRTAPLDHRIIQRNFYKGLEGIGITDEIRRDRGICFHSWRHFYNSVLINSRVPIMKVQKLTGHSTDRMTENYFHTDDFSDVLKIVGDL